MRANSTANSNTCDPFSPGTDAAAPSGPSLLHQLYGSLKTPTMVSKPAVYRGLSDQAGMRERSEQTEMTLVELQRSRGVEPPDNPHTQILDAYGCRQLAEIVMAMPMIGIYALYALGNATKFRIGPAGADAAPVGSGKAPASAKLSVDEFVKKYSGDFEIWLSPSAKNAGDMKGMIIVIVEHHHDPAVKTVVKKVMLGFRRTRGDRFFMEGGIDLTCKERIEKYLMEPGDCQLLEKDCAAFWKMKEFAEATDRKLLECVAYLRKHVPSAQEPLAAQNTFVYVEFMKRHASKLPSHANPGYQAMKVVAYEADVRATKEGERLRPERDAHMANGMTGQLTEAGLNYVIVGSDHLKGIREHLKNRRCIFMVPKLIVKEDPMASLFAGPKVEL